ncbi:AAA family ATPase [Corynebacterium striatum]|uniref:AAA family ATPase n=1 Tax=Corynebacterium striatum TaxID=43770 RepID=UPI003ACE1164|nr:AAA family ATPase [Corynebacterium striatum]
MTRGRDPLEILAETEAIAAKYRQNDQPSTATAVALPKPEPEEKTEDQLNREYRSNLFEERARDGAWLENQSFPELQFSVPSLVPEGYSLIVGSPKVGKSFWVANIALACANGGRALGGIEVSPRPVLYFALEDGDRRLQTRFHHISGNEAIPSRLTRVLEVNNLLELINISHEFQDRNPGTAPLIIVDTLGKVAGGRAGNQSQFEADYKLGSTLQNIAKRVPGCSVLAVHHTNKGEHDDFLHAVSGTQGVTAACDAVLVLTRDRKSKEALLAVTGRDITNETEYALVSNDGCWELMGNSLLEAEENAATVRKRRSEATTAGRYSDRSNMAYEAVTNSPNPINTKTVAHMLGVSSDTAGKYLRRLAEGGRIKKHGRGTWTTVSEVSEVSDSQPRSTKRDHSHLTLVSEVSETSPNETAPTSN